MNIWASAYNYRHIKNMKMGNCGTGVIWSSGTFSTLNNCELHTSSNANPCDMSSYARVKNCYLHGLTGANCIRVNAGTAHLDHVYIDYTYATNSGIAVNLNSDGARISNSIILAKTGAVGVQMGQRMMVNNCSIYGGGGTGSGVKQPNSTQEGNEIVNCVITGFSGSGGKGIEIVGTGVVWAQLGPNLFYDNETNISGTEKVAFRVADTTAGSDPFTNAGSGDFTLIDTYAAYGWPDQVGRSTTLTFIDPGASQRDETAGATSGGGQLVNAGLVG